MGSRERERERERARAILVSIIELVFGEAEEKRNLIIISTWIKLRGQILFVQLRPISPNVRSSEGWKLRIL